ncbi:hypothetical protein [Indiicoccus explosivorum]|uniref:hypothetical protein n=1 Tax=Indiicoccus explosivorum TaxID=1917864 RepID=UPI0012D83865|nr:hypothetical protein [Indiicoccus explosivorum]
MGHKKRAKDFRSVSIHRRRKKANEGHGWSQRMLKKLEKIAAESEQQPETDEEGRY